MIVIHRNVLLGLVIAAATLVAGSSCSEQGVPPTSSQITATSRLVPGDLSQEVRLSVRHIASERLYENVVGFVDWGVDSKTVRLQWRNTRQGDFVFYESCCPNILIAVMSADGSSMWPANGDDSWVKKLAASELENGATLSTQVVSRPSGSMLKY